MVDPSQLSATDSFPLVDNDGFTRNYGAWEEGGEGAQISPKYALNIGF